MAKQAELPGCGEPLPIEEPGQYYCEFIWNDGDWDLVGANHPYTYCYCTEPGTYGKEDGEIFYNYPCCNESRLRGGNTDSSYCYGTYRFQNGRFVVVDAISMGGAGCPTDLEEFSKENDAFSFAVTVEFKDVPCWATYEYKNGVFVLMDETPKGSCRCTEREDLSCYSRRHRAFYFFETIKFAGR